MKKFKRDLFFWIEKLQITRKERLVISSLMIVVVLMISLSAILKNTYNSNAEHYEEILEEFEQKSALIERNNKINEQKYFGEVVSEGNSVPVDNVEIKVIININKADIVELQKLKGIGQTYAQRIVDYRLENGEFKEIEELLNVKGIGKKRLEDIKAFITLK